MTWLILWILLHLYQSAHGSSSNAFRLPTSIVPYHYNLGLVPDIYNKLSEDFVLYGRVEIFANVTADTRSITIHSVNLTISGHVRVLLNNINIYKSRTYVKKYQWFVIHLKETLETGDKVVIQILRFYRPIDHSLIGLYYYTRNIPGTDRKQYGVTTQLQTTYARHMFPCFDEPALKATYDITIYRKLPHFSLSNGPLESSVKLRGLDWYVDKFKRSPIMPTYLVAIIVTEYKGYRKIISNTSFTIFYPPGLKDANVQLAMQISKEVFPKLEAYFGVKYPISKLDQIAFQSDDFALGGMENFGMVTYKDIFLYAKPGMEKFHKYIAKMVLHEITHQWFGNLVTMKWWDDLWLNEGMTEYYSLLRGKWIKAFQPKELGLRFVLRAMTLEMQKVLPPVHVPWAKTPDEISAMLNDVTYMKGGMIIRMAEIVMGERIFKKAMRKYVQKNMFGTVTHKDLWNAFTLANQENGKNINMSKILSPWIMQSGFPILSVKINYDQKSADYTQNLFLHSEKDADSQRPEPNPYKYVWPIPIMWQTKRGRSNVTVKFEKNGSVALSSWLRRGDWIVFNPEASFYYIVNYEKDQWDRLGDVLFNNYQVIDHITRGKLIYDIMCLFMATKRGKGYFIEGSTVVKFLRFAQYENNNFPLAFFEEMVLKSKLEELKPITDMLKRRNIGKKKPKQ